MNLHIFEVRNGEHEYTDFCVSSNDILNEKDAISYMYGEDTLDKEEDVRKGVQYYTFGDSWVGLYKTFTGLTKNEIQVLRKFWVI